MLAQFLLPKTPEKAYFLKQDERNWLANRQRREQEIRAGHNSKTGSTLREPPLTCHWEHALLFCISEFHLQN